MRSAIISQKAQEKGIAITSEAVQYLADHIQSNTRDIEGKVQEIAVLSLSQKFIHVTLEFVENYFNPTSNSVSASTLSSNSQLTPRHVISICAKHFNLKTSELCGSSRKKDLVSARHITAYLLLTETNLPLKEVGHLLGGRDHTSIMHARDKVTLDFSTNPQLRSVINSIKASF
jgi:chromosomal replication initiator protein